MDSDGVSSEEDLNLEVEISSKFILGMTTLFKNTYHNKWGFEILIFFILFFISTQLATYPSRLSDPMDFKQKRLLTQVRFNRTES